jgi:asparagine synthase (glutamine-hydrolysing)
MCGIAGVVCRSGAPVEASLLARMCGWLRHRGPDDEGYYRGPGVGLGMRRLSIIDLQTGQQPLTNEDRTIWVVGNGEIYNYQDLRADLERHGHRFTTGSDIETIVHAYEEYGAACPEHLLGMFAFALWDARAKRLLLARDRVGKKPLLYATVPDGLVFGSEFTALLTHPAVPRDVHRRAIYHYLTYGYVPGELTAFAGIHKLPPAHTLVWENGDIRLRRYWELRYGPKSRWSEAESIERFRALLRDAVRVRLMSEVPLGALLSGGVDSSAVVAMMAELSEQPVKTFSIGFGDRDYDELGYARAVAERFSTDHHELVVEPEALSILPTLVQHYGEPYADSSAIPTYYVAKLTRQHVTVALNGDGGDEGFAGYERYWAAMLAARYDRLPGAAREFAALAAGLLPDSTRPRSPSRRARRFLQALRLPAAQRYARWVGIFSDDLKHHLLTPGFAAEMRRERSGQWLEAGFAAGADGAPLDALLAADLHTYLPGDLLVKMDIASMANSLEARSPFLDHRLLEFAARLPADLKLRGRTGKYLVKRAMEGILPEGNLYRQKMGFGVPLGPWLRGPLRDLVRDSLLDGRALSRGYFAPAVVHILVDDHLADRRDYAHQLWALIMLEQWHRSFIDGSLPLEGPPSVGLPQSQSVSAL